MAANRTGAGFLEIPHAAVYLLLTANVAIYGLCLNQAGGAAIPADVLYRDGAMYTQALQRHEYWRLIAYGFLHINPVHLLGNMLCLVLWGGHLERRVGAAYFLVIYAAALVFGAIAGHFIHTTPYITAGASGATSGILGALLCLWILGRLHFPASFFISNIGLNVVIAFMARVDWGVHLGGFAAGVIACALLDLAEKANASVFRCKFPEFVKTNLLVLACALAALLWGPAAVPLGWIAVAAFAAGCLLLIKMIDIVLSKMKGLAVVAVVLAVANSITVLLASWVVAPQLASICRAPTPTLTVAVQNVLNVTCSNPTLVAVVIAGLVFILSAFLYSQDIHRGMNDVGFVGATLQAERKRQQGI
jgi:membrane associated rhomboid family serine protease